MLDVPMHAKTAMSDIGVRHLAALLTLARPVQEEIQRRSRTGIVNKGSYHAPGAPPDEKEKPLFLRVVPGSDLPVGCQLGTTACQTCNLH